MLSKSVDLGNTVLQIASLVPPHRQIGGDIRAYIHKAGVRAMRPHVVSAQLIISTHLDALSIASPSRRTSAKLGKHKERG